MEWNGIRFVRGERFSVESPSYFSDNGSIFNLCCGHGTYEPLVVGSDVALVTHSEDLV